MSLTRHALTSEVADACCKATMVRTRLRSNVFKQLSPAWKRDKRRDPFIQAPGRNALASVCQVVLKRDNFAQAPWGDILVLQRAAPFARCWTRADLQLI